MKLPHLNLLSALVSLIGSIVWILFGEVPSGLIWCIASLVWLAAAVYRMRSPRSEPHPGRRLWRRISRLLLYGS